MVKMMSEHIAMLVGAGLFLFGFTIGWNGAFFVMWVQQRQRAERLLKENDNGS